MPFALRPINEEAIPHIPYKENIQITHKYSTVNIYRFSSKALYGNWPYARLLHNIRKACTRKSLYVVLYPAKHYVIMSFLWRWRLNKGCAGVQIWIAFTTNTRYMKSWTITNKRSSVPGLISCILAVYTRLIQQEYTYTYTRAGGRPVPSEKSAYILNCRRTTTYMRKCVASCRALDFLDNNEKVLFLTFYLVMPQLTVAVIAASLLWCPTPVTTHRKSSPASPWTPNCSTNAVSGPTNEN